MKYFKETLIIFLSVLLLLIIVRENYYGRLLRRLTGTSTSVVMVKENLDKIYSNNIHKSDIVFLGNSITNSVDWNELLGLNISNQGVGGHTTEQMLKRIDNVLGEEPKHVFIMSGINDLYRGLSVDDIYKTYIELIEVLTENQIQPIVQSTLFVSYSYLNSENINNQVTLLNSKLLDFCKSNSIVFLNINESLEIDGQLNPKLCRDGIHLNSEGYLLWYKKLIPTLNKLGYYENPQRGKKLTPIN
jgi:lysophospholipase L1-like esterase